MPKVDGDVLAQRRRLARSCRRGSRKREQATVDDDQERQRREVGDPGVVAAASEPAGQRAEHERCALDHPHPAEDRLERVARAGLLEHGVVDDGVEGAGLHGEVDAEQQRGDDVGGDVGAQPADERR